MTNEPSTSKVSSGLIHQVSRRLLSGSGTRPASLLCAVGKAICSPQKWRKVATAERATIQERAAGKRGELVAIGSPIDSGVCGSHGNISSARAQSHHDVRRVSRSGVL